VGFAERSRMVEGQRSDSESRRSQDAGEGGVTGSLCSISRIMSLAEQSQVAVHQHVNAVVRPGRKRHDEIV
jgi:hypothetical protein